MPPSLPASFWHLQLFRLEHLHTLPSTFNSAPAKNPNSLCPILIKRIHLSWKSSHLFGCESSRLFSVIHVVIYLSRCRSFDLHLTSVLTWMLLSASVFCKKSQILLYDSHSWCLFNNGFLRREKLSLCYHQNNNHPSLLYSLPMVNTVCLTVPVSFHAAPRGKNNNTSRYF